MSNVQDREKGVLYVESDSTQIDDRFSVVTVRLSSPSEDEEVSVWSGKVFACKDRDVWVSRPFNRLHTATNKATSIIRKRAGDSQDTMLRNLKVFDPSGVVRPEERLKLNLSLGPSVSFQSWVEKQPLLLDSSSHGSSGSASGTESKTSSVDTPSPQPERGRSASRHQPSDATPAVTRSASLASLANQAPLRPTTTESEKGSASIPVDSCACSVSLPGSEAPYFSPSTVLERTLHDLHRRGRFVPVLAGSVLSSWYHDPGADMAQISPSLFDKYKKEGVPLQIIDSRLVELRTTTSVVKVIMPVVMIRGIGFFDLSRRSTNVSVCCMVLVNPTMTIHEACTGINMLMALQCVTDHASGVLRLPLDPSKGTHWSLTPTPTGRILEKLIANYWHGVRLGRYIHRAPDISVSAVIVPDSPFFSGISGTDSDSSSVDVQHLSAKDAFVSPSMVAVDTSESKPVSLHSRRLRQAIRRVAKKGSPGEEIKKSIALANTNFSTPTLIEDSTRSGLAGASQILRPSEDSDESDTRSGDAGPSSVLIETITFRRKVPDSDESDTRSGGDGPSSVKVETITFRRQIPSHESRRLIRASRSKSKRRPVRSLPSRVPKRKTSQVSGASARSSGAYGEVARKGTGKVTSKRRSIRGKMIQQEGLSSGSDAMTALTSDLFSSPPPVRVDEEKRVRRAINRRRRTKVQRLKRAVQAEETESSQSLQVEVARQKRATQQRIHQRLQQLAARGSDSSPIAGTLNSAPSKLTLFCSEDGMFVAQSLLEVTLREAYDLGTCDTGRLCSYMSL